MTLKLYSEYQRPVVKLEQFHNLKAMIDTGAVYPVWMSDSVRSRILMHWGRDNIGYSAVLPAFIY